MQVLQFLCILSGIVILQLVFIEGSDVDETDLTSGFRLPNNSIPLRYDLWLKTDIDKGIFDFSGKVRILVEILISTQKITLHSNELEVDKIELLYSESHERVPDVSFEYNKQFQFLIISTPKTLQKKEKFVLNIQYHGKLNDDQLGFYHGYYKNAKDEKVFYASTQFMPVDARRVMACYDEPGIQTVISVEITHGKSFNAISNMPIARREEISDSDYVTTKFEDTPPIPAYLLAFVISDFTYVSDNNTKVEQRIYAKTQSIEGDEGEFALGIVAHMLIEYEKLFGIELTLKKIDHVALTTHSFFAMENYGLFTYKEVGLLQNRKKIFRLIHKNKIIIKTIAHLMLHQYFGNLVSVKWWSYVWIHHGLATMYERIMSENIRTLKRPFKNTDGDYLRKTMEKDEETFKNKSLTRNVETPEEIEDIIDRMTAEKASCIFWMFHEALTLETFTKGLKYYLTKMSYKSASPDDLHQALQQSFDEDFSGNELNIAEAMETWENQPGFPIIHVEKKNGKFVLTQERFGGGDEIYIIPLAYATKSHANFDKKIANIWMKTKTIEIEAGSDEWILLNVGLNGYYKVSYTSEIFNAIADQLLTSPDTIPILEKNEFVELCSQFLIESKIDIATGLNIMGILKNENEFSTWQKVEKIFNFYYALLYKTEFYPKFQNYVGSILSPALSRVTFEKKSEESNNDANLRAILIRMSCAISQTECLDFGLKNVKQFLETGKDTNICEAMKSINSSVHAIVEEKLYKNDKSNIFMIHSILGCSSDPQIILNDLETVFKSEKTMNTSKINSFGTIQARSPIAAEVTLKFFSDNCEELLKT